MNFLSWLMQPFIKNVRYGFATNSSSSHSLVYLVHPEQVVDDMPDGNEFGWNMFHVFSKAAKTAYLKAQGGGWDSDYGYVDHQSVGTLSPEHVDDPHVGVIGGNDNSDSTYEELSRLQDLGVIDLKMMLVLGMIDEYDYKRVKAGDGSY